MEYSILYLGSGRILRRDEGHTAPGETLKAPNQALSALRQGVWAAKLGSSESPHVIEVGLGDPRETGLAGAGMSRTELQFHGRIFWTGANGKKAELALVLPGLSRDLDLDQKAASWLVFTSAQVRGETISAEAAEPVIAEILESRPVLAFTHLPGMLDLDLKGNPQLHKDFLSTLNGMTAALLLEDDARNEGHSS